jgi:hypothetical protein
MRELLLKVLKQIIACRILVAMATKILKKSLETALV